MVDKCLNNTVATIQCDNGLLIVAGELNFLSIMSLWERSLPFLEKIPTLRFDFSRVTFYQSAALALLLAWMKYAKRKQKKIIFQGLSEKLFSMAKMAGIDHLFLNST